MKINSTSTSNPLSGVAGGVRTDSAGAASATGQAAGGSRSSVDLSAAGRHLDALRDGSGDIQAQRIQQIRDALASGQLHIDPARIADGLLASVRDLLK